MKSDIQAYHEKLMTPDRHICEQLHAIIEGALPYAESKVWHGHPVWFLNGNPVVGYSKLKGNVRLLFWSGQSFDEPGLTPEGSFKAAEVRYTSEDEIDQDVLKRYLAKAIAIQWNYKDIVKNKGRIERI